jgi:hypothetical protein
MVGVIIFHIDNMDKNGWVTIDFMVAFMIILVTIPSITAIISDRVETVNSVREIAEAKILEENIAEIIDMVYSGGPGCSYTLKMPPKIGNKSYSITINSTGVYIMFKNHIGTEFITPIRITKSKYSNILLEPDKTYNISNIKFRNNSNEIIIEKI